MPITQGHLKTTQPSTPSWDRSYAHYATRSPSKQQYPPCHQTRQEAMPIKWQGHLKTTQPSTPSWDRSYAHNTTRSPSKQHNPPNLQTRQEAMLIKPHGHLKNKTTLYTITRQKLCPLHHKVSFKTTQPSTPLKQTKKPCSLNHKVTLKTTQPSTPSWDRSYAHYTTQSPSVTFKTIKPSFPPWETEAMPITAQDHLQNNPTIHTIIQPASFRCRCLKMKWSTKKNSECPFGWKDKAGQQSSH